jgi:hypothetical protein
VDGSVVRAHQHAAGARRQPSVADRKGDAHRPQHEALGAGGGLSSKLHLRVEGGGRPLGILVTAGQRHEAPLLPALLDAGAVRRSGPAGRPGAGSAE